MINISREVHSWEIDGAWSVSPGVSWCAKGFKIKVGSRVYIGDRVSIRNEARIGFDAEILCGACIDTAARVFSGASVGCWALVGTGSTFVANIGSSDGYSKALCSLDGVAYIGSGCRWFTINAATEHWGDHEEDRSMALCLLESAKAIASLKGLKFS